MNEDMVEGQIDNPLSLGHLIENDMNLSEADRKSIQFLLTSFMRAQAKQGFKTVQSYLDAILDS
ncbi:hypothetical protein A3844_03250 [Paenibacillus helianthi]|uniref:Uncharacterized protein n=1 Tax=Paenibacillus helianthi TaxID=1349432 RepID=A0ABX3EWQ2_9BACL|nr:MULTISPECIES: hypothetical protein [Paenibacillus]OKP84862.1 hypothetical protein A3842_07830 [Paenibacillus sp. P3E]OKP90888.1 hypothetical protein A3844_03250 [Paenibacillus helianthi]